MSQPPHGPYGGPPPGMPPQGPPTGGQPPMGPPGGMPPGGDPYGPGPGGPGDPYGPGGPGGPGDPYGGQGHGGMPPGGMPPGGMPPGGDPYGAPYPGGPQPSQPKKTSPWLFVGLGCGGLFIIGIVLVVIIVFVANDDEPSTPTGGTGGTGAPVDPETDPETDPDTDTEGTTPSGPSGGTLGDSTEHEGIIFTPLEIEGPYSELDIEGQTFTPEGEYIVLWLEVEASDSSESFWRDEQHVYTSDGTAIEEDYDATGAMDNMNKTLTPGSPLETGIVFDVPDSSDLVSVGLSAETYGGNEIEFDLN